MTLLPSLRTGFYSTRKGILRSSFVHRRHSFQNVPGIFCYGLYSSCIT